MNEQKVIEIMTSWLIAARESPNDSDASMRKSAETMHCEIARQDRIEEKGEKDKIKAIIKVLYKHVTFFLDKSGEPEKIAKEILAAGSTPDDLAEFESDPHTIVKSPHGDLKLFDPPDLKGRPLDDLTEIKSALDLPDDTPEPLVGLIWGLQQRIEDLEQIYASLPDSVGWRQEYMEGMEKKEARYVARVQIERSSGDFLIGKGGCLFTTPFNKPPPTHSSVEAAIVAMKDADDRLPRGGTRLIENAGTGEIVRTFSPDAWLQELVL